MKLAFYLQNLQNLFTLYALNSTLNEFLNPFLLENVHPRVTANIAPFLRSLHLNKNDFLTLLL